MAFARLFLILCLLLVNSVAAFADRVSYGGIHEVTATNGTLTARHVHNWSSPKIGPMFLALAQHEQFLTSANDFSFVELRNRSGAVLFHVPAPAMTTLWISPDSQYVVGLSNIKLDNPYQLVVWRKDGTVLHREHISVKVAKLAAADDREFERLFPQARCSLLPMYFKYGGSTYLDFYLLGATDPVGQAAYSFLTRFAVRHPYSNDFGESISNWVKWFDSQDPQIELVGKEPTLSLSLRSPSGRKMQIPLSR